MASWKEVLYEDPHEAAVCGVKFARREAAIVTYRVKLGEARDFDTLSYMSSCVGHLEMAGLNTLLWLLGAGEDE